jgi:hypothetical protein
LANGLSTFPNIDLECLAAAGCDCRHLLELVLGTWHNAMAGCDALEGKRLHHHLHLEGFMKYFILCQQEESCPSLVECAALEMYLYESMYCHLMFHLMQSYIFSKL